MQYRRGAGERLKRTGEKAIGAATIVTSVCRYYLVKRQLSVDPLESVNMDRMRNIGLSVAWAIALALLLPMRAAQLAAKGHLGIAFDEESVWIPGVILVTLFMNSTDIFSICVFLRLRSLAREVKKREEEEEKKTEEVVVDEEGGEYFGGIYLGPSNAGEEVNNGMALPGQVLENEMSNRYQGMPTSELRSNRHSVFFCRRTKSYFKTIPTTSSYTTTSTTHTSTGKRQRQQCQGLDG